MAYKVLYIGDFGQSFSTENYIAYGLEQIGCEVLRVQDRTIPNALAVLGTAKRHTVDFVLFSKSKFRGSDDVISVLRTAGIMTVGWIFDLFIGLPDSFKERQPDSPAFKADICCMTDGGHLDIWRSRGINHRLLRQGIHEPEARIVAPNDRKERVIFVGTITHPERAYLVDWLKSTYGNDFCHYGRLGKVRETRGLDLNAALAAAKIVVGDSVPSPHYWSNRIYEVIGRGGFLLHPKVEGLDSEFIDGVHYVGYERGNYAELEGKIAYYLAHDDEREQIRMAGHEHVVIHLTYTQRCRQLIAYVHDFKRKNKSRVLERTSAHPPQERSESRI